MVNFGQLMRGPTESKVEQLAKRTRDAHYLGFMLHGFISRRGSNRIAQERESGRQKDICLIFIIVFSPQECDSPPTTDHVVKIKEFQCWK